MSCYRCTCWECADARYLRSLGAFDTDWQEDLIDEHFDAYLRDDAYDYPDYPQDYDYGPYANAAVYEEEMLEQAEVLMFDTGGSQANRHTSKKNKMDWKRKPATPKASKRLDRYDKLVEMYYETWMIFNGGKGQHA